MSSITICPPASENLYWGRNLRVFQPASGCNFVIDLTDGLNQIAPVPDVGYLDSFDLVVSRAHGIFDGIPQIASDHDVPVRSACLRLAIDIKSDLNGVYVPSLLIWVPPENRDTDGTCVIVTFGRLGIRRDVHPNRTREILLGRSNGRSLTCSYRVEKRTEVLYQFHKCEYRVIAKPWGELKKDWDVTFFFYNSVDVNGADILSGKLAGERIQKRFKKSIWSR